MRVLNPQKEPLPQGTWMLHVLPYLVLALSLALTLYFWFLYDASLQKRQNLIYRTRTDQIQTRIKKGMHDVEQILRGAAGLIYASDEVTRDEWRRYVDSLGLVENYPGILGVGWTEWILPQDKEAHERRIRAEGFPGYSITPPGKRSAYTAIVYLEPFDWRNRRAFGYDMFSEPVRRRAMEEARDSGRAAVAATVILVQETGKDRQNGMLMYLPVYRRGARTDSVEQRRAALTGFVYSPVRIKDFISSNLEERGVGIQFRLSSSGVGEEKSILFDSAMLEGGGVRTEAPPELHSEAEFERYGRKWRLSFWTLPSFAREVPHGASYAALLGGAVISLLLSLVTFMILAARDRALTMAKMHREQEERYRAYFNLPTVGFGTVAPDRSWIDVNEALCAMLGYEADELRGLTWDLVTYHRDLDADALQFRRVLDGEIAGYSLDKRFVRKDGTLVWTALSAHSVRSAEGTTEYVIFHLKDITKRKKAEAENLRLSAMLEESQHMAHIGGWEMDLITRSLFWSRETYLIHDTTPEEYTPTIEAALEFYTPVSREVVAAAVKDAVEEGKDFSQELDLVTARGRLVKVYVTSKVIREGGVTTRIMGAVQDITERKEYEETLRRSEEKYRRLVEGLGTRHCVFSHTVEGVFLYLSRGVEALFGIPAEELVGKDWRSIGMTPESQRAREEADRRILETRGSQVIVITCIRPDGSHRIIEMSYGPIVEGESVVRMEGICTDVTEEVNLQNQLQQAQKMESVGRLAGGVAHDFNNLLTVILGHAEMGLLKLDEVHPVRANLMEIRSTAERSANLTRQLLAFASKQTIAPKVLNLNDTVGAMLTMLQRLIGEDIRLVWQPDLHLWQVRTDSSQIDQILANLCINARDAIESRGTITLETRNVEVDSQYCAQHPDATPGQFVRLSVSDDGVGIDPQTLTHIFEPFYTTKGFGHGTGLGLATVYGAVRQNNGFITVESEIGKGTTFGIHLPRHQEEESRPPAEQDAALPAPGRETILLVEDEEAILRMTALMLEQQGYTVLASSSPKEALRLAQTHHGAIDLVVTDVIMPEMNGKELVAALSEERPAIRQLYMSGYTADVIAPHGVLDPGVNFIQKPFPMAAIAAKVREVLDKKG